MTLREKKEQVLAIRKVFDTVYADADCTLDYQTPFQLLIATQLAAQCTDARVNIVTKDLFQKYRSVEDFAAADLEELEQDIRSTGFYHNKAKNIIGCAQKLLRDFGGTVPDNLEDLLSLPGVGRKTANLVLGDVFGKNALVIDTHAGRLSRRFGLTKETDPTKVEFALMKMVPEDYMARFCHQMVMHGRAFCTARNPKCTSCPLNHLCPSSQSETIQSKEQTKSRSSK